MLRVISRLPSTPRLFLSLRLTRDHPRFLYLKVKGDLEVACALEVTLDLKIALEIVLKVDPEIVLVLEVDSRSPSVSIS